MRESYEELREARGFRCMSGGTKSWPTSAIVVTGVLGGLLLGGALLLALGSSKNETSGESEPPPPTENAERWFMWSGSGPLNGHAFASLNDCEDARLRLLDNVETEISRKLENAPSQVTRLEYEMIMSEISDIRSRANRVYCKQA